MLKHKHMVQHKFPNLGTTLRDSLNVQEAHSPCQPESLGSSSLAVKVMMRVSVC